MVHLSSLPKFYLAIKKSSAIGVLLFLCQIAIAFSPAFALENATAQLEHAKESYFAGDYGGSANLFKPLADGGNAEAQYYLGIIYTKDQFPQKDADTALSYLLSAADQNYHDAMWQLGQMYENGDGVPKDLLTATDWYRKSERSAPTSATAIQFYKTTDGELAEKTPDQVITDFKRSAEAGDVESLYKLGKIYDVGVLTQADEDEAYQWYLKAANKGHEYSAFMAGYFYCRGIGVTADPVKANEWLAKSKRDAKCK